MLAPSTAVTMMDTMTADALTAVLSRGVAAFGSTDRMDEKFWAKVARRGSGECWEWQGARDEHGYGHVHRRPRYISAHRLSWELTTGSIPDGLFVCHRCDNPRCVNPQHLFLGSHAENVADMVAKGRSARGDRNGMRRHPDRRPRGVAHGLHIHPESIQRGSDHHHAKLNEEDVRAIRARVAGGEPQRSVARDYGVVETVVSRVVHRKSWRHVA